MPGAVATTVYAAAVLASFGAVGVTVLATGRPRWAAEAWPFVAAASAASVLTAPEEAASIALAVTVVAAAAVTMAQAAGVVTRPIAAQVSAIAHVGAAAGVAWGEGATVAAVTCTAAVGVCGILLWK